MIKKSRSVGRLLSLSLGLGGLLVGVWCCPSLAQNSGGDSEIPTEIDFPSSAGQVAFPHRLHFEELGIDCGDCHHETNAAILQIPHQEYFRDFWIHCETCHQGSENPELPHACGDCHHTPPVDIADETLSAKVVIHRSCWACHEVGTGQEASRSCGSCHAGPRAGLQEARGTTVP